MFDFLKIDYSTEEENENEDKAELVTLRYSMTTQSSHTQEPEQNWIPLTFDKHANSSKDKLLCQKVDNKLKLDYTDDEFIKRLVDNGNPAPPVIKAEPIIKTEKNDVVEKT